MLAFDTAERATAEECLRHSFLQDAWQPSEDPPGGQLYPRGRGLATSTRSLDQDQDEEEEEVIDDYDLNEDEMESNLLAMSNSLQILDNDENLESSEAHGHPTNSVPSASPASVAAGDCFGSTGLFTAM